MKGIVLILLVALVAAEKFPGRSQKTQTRTQNPDTGTENVEIRPEFRGGQLRIYNYNATVETGMQYNDFGKSLIKIEARILIKGGQQQHLLEIRDVKFEAAAGFHPRNSLLEAPKEIKQFHDCNQYPIVFSYSGRIESIRVRKETPLFCKNMGRSILNMIIITSRNQKEYELQEDGIEGECNTRYAIYEEKRSNSYIFNRFRDLNNCKQRVMLSTGMPFFQVRPNYFQRERLVQGTSAFVIKVKHDRTGDQITQVKSEQIYQFPLISEDEGAGYMKAQQLLALIDVKPEKLLQQQQQGMLEVISIRSELPRTLPLPVMDVPNRDPMPQAETLLQESVRWPQLLPKEVTSKIQLLNRIIQRMSYNDLNTLFTKVENIPRARKNLLISCSYAGNLNGLKLMRDKLINGSPQYNEMVWNILTTFHFANPDTTRVEETAKVAAEILSKITDKESVLAKLTYLGYANMVWKQCSISRTCHPKLLEPLHNLLTEAVRGKNENKIVLALKAIANAGQLASLKQVKLLCESAKYPKYLQIIAIQTLVQIGKQDPTKVQGTLLQIFMDTSRCTPARIVACIGLLENNPPVTVVTGMANAMLYEDNLQIVSFFYSHLKSITNVRDPMYYSLASACSMALKLLNSRLGRTNFHYSRALYFSFFNSLLTNGGTLKFYMFGDDIFPSNVIFSSDITFAHFNIPLFEIAVNTKGISKLFEESASQSDQYPTYQKIKDTVAKLPGFQELPDQKPFFDFSVKTLGKEMFYLNSKEINPSLEVKEYKTFWIKTLMKVVETIFKTVTTDLSHHMVLDAGQIHPTVVGLPFEVNANAILALHGSWKAKSELPQEDLSAAKVQVQLDSNIDAHGQGILSWGIHTDYVESKVEINGRIRSESAFRLNVSLDVPENRLKAEVGAVREKFETITASHEAHVVVRYPHVEKKAPILPEGLDIDALDEGFDANKGNIKQQAKRGYRPQEPQGECLPVSGVNLCFQTTKKTGCMFNQNIRMHALCSSHEMRASIKTDPDVEKVHLDVQLGLGKLRMRREMVSEEEEQEEEEQEEEEQEEEEQEEEEQEEEEQEGDEVIIEEEADSKYQKKPAGKAKRPDPMTGSSSDSSTATSPVKKRQNRKEGDSSSSTDSYSEDSNDSSSRKGKGSHHHGRKHHSRDSSSSSSGGSSSSSDSSSSSSSDSSSSSSSDSSSSSSSDSSSSSSSDSSSSSSSDSSKSCSKHSSSSDSSDRKSGKHSSDSSDSKSGKHSSSSSSSDSSDSKSCSKHSSSSDSSDTVSSESSSENNESDDISEKGAPKEIHEYSFRSVKKLKPGRQQSDFPSDLSRQVDKRKGSLDCDMDVKDSSLRQLMSARLRIIRNDKKQDGLDAVLFERSTNAELKMAVKSITRPRKPVMCLEYVATNPHKVALSLRANWNYKDYRVSLETETGWLAEMPALQVKFKYPKLTAELAPLEQEIAALIPGVANMAGFSYKVQNNPPREVAIIMALKQPSEGIVVVKLPDVVLYNENCMLPFSVPLDPNIKTSKISDIKKVLLASQNGICTVQGKRITTFNGQIITEGLPSDCYIYVTGDCTCYKKMMVVMKYESEYNNSVLLDIHVAGLKITFKQRGSDLIAEINDTKLENAVFPAGFQGLPLRMTKKTNELEMSLPKFGLVDVTYRGYSFMLKINSFLENSCGICGQRSAQGKIFRRPSGHLAKDEVSFAQSWVVPDECGGACKLQHSTVRHEHPVLIEQENLQCATNLPVTRCAEGCSATSTTKILAGFHCVSAGATLPTELTVLAEKSEDLIDTIESHTSCSCEQEQCTT